MEFLPTVLAILAVCAALAALVFVYEFWSVLFARLPIRLLRNLARKFDQSHSVAYAVAANPRVTTGELTALAEATNQYVRCLVARHPKTDEATMRILAKDEAKMVRLAITENPSAPDDVAALIALEMMVDGSR